MRNPIASLAVVLLVACGGGGTRSPDERGYRPPAGWEYRPDHGVPLTYLDETRDVEFVGLCKGTPEYLLSGGNYPAGATQFTLTVDDKSWTLPAWQGEHGRGLWVDQHEQELAIAKAKRRIVFQVGTWRREIKPGPELANFVKDCA